MGEEPKTDGFVATLDIGTSSVRCLIINKNGDHVGSSRRPVSTSVLQPTISKKSLFSWQTKPTFYLQTNWSAPTL